MRTISSTERSVWRQLNPISSIKNVVRRRWFESNSPIIRLEIFEYFEKLWTPNCDPSWTWRNKHLL